jgi:hypothetical protein
MLSPWPHEAAKVVDPWGCKVASALFGGERESSANIADSRNWMYAVEELVKSIALLSIFEPIDGPHVHAEFSRV